MSTIPQVSHAMQHVLLDMAHTADADLHFTRRTDQAKFTASTLTQTLVFGWLAHPNASLEQLAQCAARVGVTVSAQAIDQRLTMSTAALLKQVLCGSLNHVVTGDAVLVPVLQRFTGVFVHDSTTIVLPNALAHLWQGCGGTSDHNTQAALKCGVQLDLLTGSLTALDLAAGRVSDHRLPLQHAPLPKGSLRLADLGFYDLKVLTQLHASEAYFLTKLESSAVIGLTSTQSQPLVQFVERLGVIAQWQGDVWIGSKHPLKARLFVQRVPQEVADARRRRIRQTARAKGNTPSATTLALAAWTLLLTNAPAELLSLEEALVVARVRWQIELLFKLWKSHGQIDQWRTGNAERVLCEVYAKLLAMVLQHWILLVGCWAYADRSLVKAAQVVRDHAPELAGAQARVAPLTTVLETVRRVLARHDRMNTRATQPNTYQLLLALTRQDKGL